MTNDSAIRRFREAFDIARQMALTSMAPETIAVKWIDTAEEAALALVHVPGCLCKFGLGGNALFDVACEMLREKLRGGE